MYPGKMSILFPEGCFHFILKYSAYSDYSSTLQMKAIDGEKASRWYVAFDLFTEVLLSWLIRKIQVSMHRSVLVDSLEVKSVTNMSIFNC